MDIHVFNNIFSKEEREKLIFDVQPLLQDGKYISAKEFGGDGVYQEGFEWFKITNPTLHLHSSFTWAHDRIIEVVKDELGLDLNDDSISGTPYRVAKMYVKEIFSGLDPANKPRIFVINDKLLKEKSF